ALPLGGRDRGRDRDAPREGHHEDHTWDDRRLVRLPRHEGRHAARAGPGVAHRLTVFDPVDPAVPVAAGVPEEQAEQPVRRHLSERQAEVMERLLAAAAAEAEERPYGDISVRTIAKRAGVAPATAYTYFSGKDHLLAEVLWRCVQASPPLVDLTVALPERVADTVRTMGFQSMGPAAVAACTTALLGDGPDVKRVRARIGAEIGRRLAAALGDGTD